MSFLYTPLVTLSLLYLEVPDEHSYPLTLEMISKCYKAVCYAVLCVMFTRLVSEGEPCIDSQSH